MIADPAAVLKRYWGFDSFRPLQEEIIQSILDGRDTLALMPTGGGKSICFQVPALCKEGVCIVVSPLIALMKDQVANLQKRGISAIAIFSGMSHHEIDIAFDNCVHGAVKFLYLSPERLKTDLARARIERMKVNLIAVDEAHCISQWGYDFRPAYLEIAAIREWLPDVPVLALTATATPEVVNDIQQKLHFKESNVLRKSFKRDNLAYVVLHEEDKLSKLLHILKRVPGSGIVYVRTRRLTVDIARELSNRGIQAAAYHAGLDVQERSRRQDQWIKGSIRVMVATNAFGMGIDKPDVRTVIHMHLPDSLEAYFQEAGRAGRDGKKSYAVLLYNAEDKLNLERQFEHAFPSMEDLRRVYAAIGSYYQVAVGSPAGLTFDFDFSEFCNNFKLSPLLVHNALKVLEQEGWIYLSDSYYLPSTFKVRMNREQLYDFQLRNPSLDPLIKTLLRVSEGAFHHFVNLHEAQIARHLKIDSTKLVKALQHLHSAGVIEYRPAKERPQLTFTHERVDPANLSIDHELYNFRKERFRQRIDKAIEYATSEVCRSQQLLKYFGELSEPCGTCDVCLASKDKGLSKEEYERYKQKIAHLLAREPLTEKQLLESFSSNRHAKVIQALTYLLEEGLAVKTDNFIRWVSPAK